MEHPEYQKHLALHVDNENEHQDLTNEHQNIQLAYEGMDHEDKKLLDHTYDHQKELGQMASERDLLLMDMELEKIMTHTKTNA